MAKGWTLERRRRQAERIRTWKPWERSTGPRTLAGKARISLNAYDGERGRSCEPWPRRCAHISSCYRSYKNAPAARTGAASALMARTASYTRRSKRGDRPAWSAEHFAQHLGPTCRDRQQ